MNTCGYVLCGIIALLVAAVIWQALATLGREKYWQEKLRQEAIIQDRFYRANEILRSYMDGSHLVWNHGQSPQDFLDKKNFDVSEVILITAPDLRDLLNGAWTLYKDKKAEEA